MVELVNVGGEVLETSEVFAGLNGQMTPLASVHGTSLQLSEKLPEARGSFEGRDGFEDLERGGEAVLQAPLRARCEIGKRRIEILSVNFPCEVSGCFEFVLHERFVDN